MKFLNALQEDAGNNFSYLVLMNIVNGGGGGGDNLPRGKVSPHPLNSHACFHFYVMTKGMRRAWLFVVSESPSRGYWKQFLLSRPCKHSQYLPVVVGKGGGGQSTPG